MRAKFDPSFSQFLLRVGNGTKETVKNDKIRIPNCMLLPYKDDITSKADLIRATFPDPEKQANNSDFIAARAILTPKNEFIDELNDLLINSFPCDPIKYYSFNSAIDDKKRI